MACERGPPGTSRETQRFSCGPSTSAGSRAAPLPCGLCTEPEPEWQLHTRMPSSYPHVFISQQILQRWRFLRVRPLKLKVFSSGRNHQRHRWTPPLAEVARKLSYSGTEIKNQRNQESTELAHPRVTTATLAR